MTMVVFIEYTDGKTEKYPYDETVIDLKKRMIFTEGTKGIPFESVRSYKVVG